MNKGLREVRELAKWVSEEKVGSRQRNQPLQAIRKLVEGEERTGRCPDPRVRGAAAPEVLTVTLRTWDFTLRAVGVDRAVTPSDTGPLNQLLLCREQSSGGNRAPREGMAPGRSEKRPL